MEWIRHANQSRCQPASQGGEEDAPGVCGWSLTSSMPGVKHRLSKVMPVTTSFHVVGDEVSTAGKKLCYISKSPA